MADAVATDATGLADLIRRLAAGEGAAWGLLPPVIEADVRGIGQRILGDPTLSDDVVQETLLAIRSAAGRFRIPAGAAADAAARSWVLAIASHVALKMVRLRQRRRRRERLGGLPAAAAPPGARIEQVEQAALVRQALGRLPTGSASVILLHHVAGLSFAEIATHLRLPEGTAKARAARGMRLLRRRLLRLGVGAPAVLAVLPHHHAPLAMAATGASTGLGIGIGAACGVGAAVIAAGVVAITHPRSHPAATPWSATAAPPQPAMALALPAHPRRVLRVGPHGDYASLAALPPLRPGDAIEVEPGRYTDAVALAGVARPMGEDAPVTIRAVGAMPAILDGSHALLDGIAPHPRAMLQLAGGSWIIEGVVVEHATNADHNADGIRAEEAAVIRADHLVLRDCDVGILAHQGGSIAVTGSSFARCGNDAVHAGAAAILASGMDEVLLDHCTITDSPAGAGIWTDAARLAITQCHISGAGGGRIEITGPPGAPGTCVARIVDTTIHAQVARGRNRAAVVVVAHPAAEVTLQGDELASDDPVLAGVLLESPRSRASIAACTFHMPMRVAGPGQVTGLSH